MNRLLAEETDGTIEEAVESSRPVWLGEVCRGGSNNGHLGVSMAMGVPARDGYL